MGNSSGTNAPKESVVIAAIVDEKNKWLETLSGAEHPDMNLINAMMFNTNQRLHRYVQQIHSQSIEIQTDPDKRTIELKEKLGKLQTEEELTLRLSKVDGEKLMEGNLNVTDLSDKNRPTQLGVVNTELYDNEWTDAYESLTKSGHKDDQAIGTLLETLQIHSKSVEIQTDPEKRTIEMKEELDKLQTEKTELTLRLSKVLGEKLMKDNPYITDLSDKNRPTKLGEVYTEKYDNEWTDAYEALTKSGYKDTEAIETLSKTLKIHSISVEIQTDPEKRTIEMKEELDKLQTEKTELTLRLSKVLGEKLMKDNPNITDLNDKNRPTKLGEVYTELYDNEWTDAYEVLTKSGYKDTEAIETLLKTLKVCFDFCQSKADQLLESTVKAAANVLYQEVHEQVKDQKKFHQTLKAVSKDKRSDVGVFKLFFFKTLSLQCRWKSTNSGETQQTLDGLGTIYQPPSFEEELKRTNKQMSQVLIPVVQNAFLKTYWDAECMPAMKPFIKKCLFLCWMMVVQGPPMCFDWSTNQGSQLDANLYRHYTALGTVVEFVVWPALFLHKEGPIIAKGTAQPYVGKSS